jgi:NAD(P)-dependent dehydrogenase (short-subunit alcohol dehydrogenase family)
MSATNAFSLSGKTAIVTGASRGIGEAIARQLASAGANVVLASRKIDGLQGVADSLTSAGLRAVAQACHAGKPEECDRLVERAVKEFGQVDILVNNAATNPHFGPMMTADWGMWDKTFEVNVKGYFALSRAVAQHLIDRGAPGSIIQIASVVGQMGAPLQGIYGMTKAAVISMTKTLSMELGPMKIRVNAIAPGLVETRFASALTNDETLRNMIVGRTALGRIGQPEDIAGAALFLASDASSYVTGTTLVVDGGWTVG